MVVSGSDVAYQRAERVERRSGAIDDLTIHVFPNFVHRNMSRTFDNHLNVVLPSDFRQFAEHFQFAELRLVVCVGNAARAQAVAERESDVVFFEQFADFFEVSIQEILFLIDVHPFGEDRSAARDDTGDAFQGGGQMFLKDSGVNRKIVYPLFALLDERIVVDFPCQVLDFAMHFLQRLIHGDRSDRNRRIPQNGLAGFMNVLAGR